MTKKTVKPRQREIGKTKKQEKHLIDPRYKNFFWTVIFLVVLLIFFIINNTRDVPESGPFPPGYNAQRQQEALPKDIPQQLNIK
jgi:hypothetical protein